MNGRELRNQPPELLEQVSVPGPERGQGLSDLLLDVFVHASGRAE